MRISRFKIDKGWNGISTDFARLAPDSIAVGVTEPASEIEQLRVYPNTVTDKVIVNGQ